MVSRILLQFMDVQSFDVVLNGGSDIGYAGRGGGHEEFWFEREREGGR